MFNVTKALKSPASNLSLGGNWKNVSQQTERWGRGKDMCGENLSSDESEDFGLKVSGKINGFPPSVAWNWWSKSFKWSGFVSKW